VKTLRLPNALGGYKQLHGYRHTTGIMIAALLLLNAKSSQARTEDAKATVDAAMVAAHAAAKGDGLLEALLTELDRSKSQLKMDQVGRPITSSTA